MHDSFTLLFERVAKGDRAAMNLLYELTLPELRRVAAGLLRRHRSHQTLPPTALINESWLKLRFNRLAFLSREHFFRISARAMRQVLIDRGRVNVHRKAAFKEFAQLLGRLDPPQGPELHAAREILDQFEKVDAGAARIIRLHYLDGYSWDEIGRLTGREVWRVRDDASFALRWMRKGLT